MFDKIGASFVSIGTGIILMILGVFIPIIGPVLIFLGIASFLAAIVGPFLGIKPLRLPCPYCETEIATMSNKKGVTCKACKQRILIKNNEFVKI